MNKKNPSISFKLLTIVFFTFSVLSITTLNSPAYSSTSCPPPTCCCGKSCGKHVSNCSTNACACQSNKERGTLGIGSKGTGTRGHSQYEFIMHQEFIIKNIWEAHILPTMMLMAQQMTTASMQQVQIIGTFFDAKHQLESQRLLQTLQAKAHKDYHPSVAMCRINTNTRSLAIADRNATLTQIGLAARSTNRLLMTGGAIGTGSARDDSRSRLDQFIGTYCNPNDFGHALDLLCASTAIERRNRDLNYTYNMQQRETLPIDFTDATATPEEEDALALSANLYGNKLLPRFPERTLADPKGKVVIDGAKAYMSTRALAAKRSTLLNTYATQIGKKSSGGQAVTPYATETLKAMGLPNEAITRILDNAPSYHAQMELLTKKIYQWPNFYANLYDKPANIDRIETSMIGIGVMQLRDQYQSQLNLESNTAVWLETNVDKLQNYHANEVIHLKNDTKVLTGIGL